MLDYFKYIAPSPIYSYLSAMKINVPEKYADLYLKALGEKKRVLEAKIEDFRREIEEIENHISTLTSLPIFQDNNTYDPRQWKAKGYQPEWPWTKKIAYYQEFRQKIFTSSEIVEFIIENEQSLNKSKVRSSISAALSNNNKSGKYIKFIDPVTSTAYYGPAEWFLNEREPQLDYLPNDLKDRLLGN